MFPYRLIARALPWAPPLLRTRSLANGSTQQWRRPRKHSGNQSIRLPTPALESACFSLQSLFVWLFTWLLTWVPWTLASLDTSICYTPMMTMMYVFPQVVMGVMLSIYKLICRQVSLSDVTHLRASHSAGDISRSIPWKYGGSRTAFPSLVISPKEINDLH